MRARSSRLSFPDAERALVYIAAGRGLSAGLPPDRALEASVELAHGRTAAALRSCAALTRRGTSVLDALASKGLVHPLDRAVLDSAEQAGRLDAALSALGKHYESRHQRFARLKGRMLLPGFILLVAILIGPLPGLVAGSVSAGQYLLHITGLLTLVALVVYLVYIIRGGTRARGWPAPITRAALHLPVVGQIVSLELRATAYSALHLMLSSGIPALDAVRILRDSAQGTYRSEQMNRAERSLLAGATLTAALADAGMLKARTDEAIMLAAETAGRIESGFAHLASACAAELEDWHRGLAVWVPAIVYALVAGYVAAGFF